MFRRWQGHRRLLQGEFQRKVGRSKLLHNGGIKEQIRHSYAELQAPSQGTWVPLWLGTSTAITFSIVVVGGITRLTESGLSMVEWHPVTGIKPPITDAEWEVEFNKYKQYPEYEILNTDMSLSSFKSIFYMEWGHRILGRVLGVFYTVPLVYYWKKGKLSSKQKRLGSLVALGIGFQGVLGWLMVRSGLQRKEADAEGYIPRVSQYRLAAHLGTAMILYGQIYWLFLDSVTKGGSSISLKILESGSGSVVERAKKVIQLHTIQRKTKNLLVMAFATSLLGAFVAGLDAGLFYNTFPLMNGKVVPLEEINDGRDYMDNEAFVQFMHRLFGIGIVAHATSIWVRCKRANLFKELPLRGRASLHLMLAVAWTQVGLGITTLLHMVPVSLGAMHQGGALTLFTVLITAVHALRRIRF